jgi:zinc protease
MRDTHDDAAAGRMRLDKWLWAARLFKTRALAVAAIDGGRVQVEGERVKRARLIGAGDRIRIRRGPFEYNLTVRALAERRGPAKEAAALYQEDPMSQRAREELALQLKAMPSAFYEGKGRPTKKQRRELDRLKRHLVVCLALALPQPSAAQDPGARLPVDSQVTVGTLDNGIRFLVRANRRPERRAELRLVVRVGSVFEDDDQLGLAHFAEHMAFNGTARFPRQALVDYLESIGMKFGPEVNAYTSFDETVYMIQVPTDSPAVVTTAFDILEDWASAVSFDSVEIDKERGVVIEEWRAGRGAGARMRDQQLPIILKGSRYADRLPIGKRELLATFPHDAVRRFYRDWYRPGNMAVVAVGDFDPAGVVRRIREHFGRIPAPVSSRPRPTFDVPDNTEPLFAIASDPEATSTSVAVYFKQPLRDASTVAAYRTSIVERLFLNMLNTRLFELSQQADPSILGGGAGQGRFIGTKEVFTLGAGVREGGTLRGLDALLTEAERVARFGFTSVELDRARAELLRSMEQAFAEREKTESSLYADEYVRHVLEAEPIPGIAAELALHRQFLPTVTLDEVNRLARAWVTPHNRVIVVSAPRKDGVPLPTEAELAAVFTAVAGKTIAAHTDTLGDVPLVAQPPRGGRITAERAIPEVGVTEWTLSNGVHVILKPTDFKADEVLVRAVSPGGVSLARDDIYPSAEFASMVASVSGAGAFSAVDLQKLLAGKVASVQPYIGDEDEGFSGNASPRDLETLFQLLYLYGTAPRRDTAAFAAFRTRILTFARNRGANPEAVFGDTLMVTMARGHPRVRPLSGALVEAIQLDTALAFYRNRFADFGDFTFFLVGNIQPDSLRSLVETWLGGLPSAGRTEGWRDLGIRPPSGVVQKTVLRGVEPKARTSLVFSGAFDESRKNRYLLRSLGDALEIRLREVLREDMGGVYGVSAGASSRIVPDTAYSVSIGFGADPARIDELVEAVFRELHAFQEAGPADSIVQKVKETQRRTRETQLKENRYWLSQLVAAHLYQTDPRNILTYEELIDALTAADIRDAARRYVRFDNYVRVTLRPEAPNP